jgi:anti-sigma factor RsiW
VGTEASYCERCSAEGADYFSASGEVICADCEADEQVEQRAREREQAMAVPRLWLRLRFGIGAAVMGVLGLASITHAFDGDRVASDYVVASVVFIGVAAFCAFKVARVR